MSLKKKRSNGRFKPTYFDKDLMDVLTDKPQSTGSIRTKLQEVEYTDEETGNIVSYKTVSYSWVKNHLMALCKDKLIEGYEIEAGSGTGKMWIWKKKQ